MQTDDLPKYEHLREKAESCPELDPRATEAWVALNRVGEEVIGAGGALLAGRGLSTGRFASLMVLNCRGATSPSDLAECAGVTRASMTAIVDSLVSEGHVVREQSTEDRRMQVIRMTDAGHTYLDEFLPGYFGAVAKLMSGLDESEQAQLTRLLLKLRSSIKGWNDLNVGEHVQHSIRSGGTHT